MRHRLLLGTAAAIAVAAAALLGGVFRDSSTAGGIAPRVASEQLAAGFASGDTTSLVTQLQAEVRARPDDGEKAALLGLAYQQRARETGDASYYVKSGQVLRRAIATAPNNLLAVNGLGALALAQHRFRDAHALGLRAKKISPTTARSYGVIGDGLLELGRYDEAFAAFDAMTRLRPGLASYSRVSYARELLGDIDGAEEAMQLALDTAAGRPEPTAWTLVQLGKLSWGRGRLDAAARLYREALRVNSGYIYALDALAQVEGARGHYGRAIALERQAVAAVPLPQFVAQLGDLLVAAGKPAEAQEQFRLVGAIEQLQIANGLKIDLESALYRVDHGIRLPESLALARRARAARPSILGDDVLAWALARNGRCAEARDASERSLRLGRQDATFLFHRGMIERCLGNEDTARDWFSRALDLNPHFSLRWAPVARKAVA
ncbi:MAG: tetratricopeptide repeat protein [Gaiellaceae bacterium]